MGFRTQVPWIFLDSKSEYVLAHDGSTYGILYIYQHLVYLVDVYGKCYCKYTIVEWILWGTIML